EGDADRAIPRARVHSSVHRERGLLVAVSADLHGPRGVLRRADELVHVRLDRAVELDRVDRTGVDHRAVTGFRDHLDTARYACPDHPAQVRLWRDRDGSRISAVSAD